MMDRFSGLENKLRDLDGEQKKQKAINEHLLNQLLKSKENEQEVWERFIHDHKPSNSVRFWSTDAGLISTYALESGCQQARRDKDKTDERDCGSYQELPGHQNAVLQSKYDVTAREEGRQLNGSYSSREDAL